MGSEIDGNFERFALDRKFDFPTFCLGFPSNIDLTCLWGRLFSSFEHQKRGVAEKHTKIIEFCKGPRLNFSLEIFLCAILSKMVSFDADLHSKHENPFLN